jgi:hypothetical protein
VRWGWFGFAFYGTAFSFLFTQVRSVAFASWHKYDRKLIWWSTRIAISVGYLVILHIGIDIACVKFLWRQPDSTAGVKTDEGRRPPVEQPKQVPTESPAKPKPNKQKVPYPWISARGTALGNPIRVMLLMTVREYPSTRKELDGGVMSISSLFSVFAMISTHVSLVGDQGKDMCTYYFRRSEFRNDLILESFIGFVPLERDATPISFRISARNGVWDGYIILRRRNDGVDYDQVSHGTLINPDGSKRSMVVKETRHGDQINYSPDNIPDRLSREMLQDLGVPVVDVNRPKNFCPSIGIGQ